MTSGVMSPGYRDARPRYADDDYDDEPQQPLRRGPSPAARRPIEQPGAPLDVEPMPRPDNRGEGRPQRGAKLRTWTTPGDQEALKFSDALLTQ